MLDRTGFWVRGMAALVLVGVIALAIHLAGPVVPTAGERVPGWAPAVVIDVGHGGYDGGAEWGSVQEKDINLAMARQLREILLAAGFRVAMTRYGDYSLVEQGEVSGPKKRADMARRLAIIEGFQPAAFVSLHCNAIGSTRWAGGQTFFQEGMEQGKLLADDIQRYLVLFTDTHRSAMPIDHFLLRESSSIGCVVEMGFLSNPAERQLLQQREYQRRLATAIFFGIGRYLHYPASHQYP